MTELPDKSYALELDGHELASVRFSVGERRWRAHLAIHSGELPVPERAAYQAEVRQLDALDAKLTAALRNGE